MLDALEALVALRDLGTTGQAATRLRITQSAVSKRLAALAEQLGEPVVERRGRRVELTPRARELLARLEPLLAELRAALATEDRAAKGTLTVGVSESVLASWGAGVLARVREALPGLVLELHAHRSPVVADRVAAGEYALGLIAGGASDARGLAVTELAREPMALLGAKAHAAGPVVTIEARSGTWESLSRKARQLGLAPGPCVESFFAAAQLAAQGFGRGLVPVGVYRALQLPDELPVHVYGVKTLARPISVVARPSMLGRPLVQAFVSALASQCAALPQLDWR